MGYKGEAFHSFVLTFVSSRNPGSGIQLRSTWEIPGLLLLNNGQYCVDLVGLTNCLN